MVTAKSTCIFECIINFQRLRSQALDLSANILLFILEADREEKCLVQQQIRGCDLTHLNGTLTSLESFASNTLHCVLTGIKGQVRCVPTEGNPEVT